MITKYVICLNRYDLFPKNYQNATQSFPNSKFLWAENFPAPSSGDPPLLADGHADHAGNLNINIITHTHTHTPKTISMKKS